MDKEGTNFFNEYIEIQRAARNISMEDLCEGLCNYQTMQFLKRGERVFDSLLQEMLLERAAASLEKYRSIHNQQSRLEKQFYLSMLAQIRRQQGASQAELFEIFRKAIHLTVPKFEQKPLGKLVLSLKELNLMLELEHCREALRMYYLWEILDVREKLLKQRIGELLGQREKQKADKLCLQKQEKADWRIVLEKVYVEFHVPKETFEYCYFYTMKGVSCINDVIRMRREMLGISQAELCKGFCDIKTIKRLEKREKCTQRAIVRELFQRLNLSDEYLRTSLVTEKQEVKLLKDELYSLFYSKKISSAEYCSRMREALELTVPFEAFLKKGEKYLTHTELLIIQNMMQGMDKDSEEFLTCLERFEEYFKPYEEDGLIDSVSSVYNSIMAYVGSERGNQGDFECSDKYFARIAEGCLRSQKLQLLPHVIYNLWWNYEEKEKKGISADKTMIGEVELKKAIFLSRLCKQKKREQFYLSKLEQLK